jgi:Ca2+-binding RTX toxin-like protein
VQHTPTITGLAGGGFVVMWGDRSTFWNGSGEKIKAQMFDAAGARIGEEFFVSNPTDEGQGEPAVAGLSGGGFVVTWCYAELGSFNIKAQIFDAVGSRIGAEFIVNTATDGNQLAQTITALEGGGFVVTWQQDSLIVDYERWGTELSAQIFDASGVRIGEEFGINDGDGLFPSITSLSGGGFVVTWWDISDNSGNYIAGANITAQMFGADGARIGETFVVNTTTEGSQFPPAITSLVGGGFVVTWYNSGSIAAQIFDATGAKVGDEFVVDFGMNFDGNSPTITSLAGGGFVVAWAGSDNSRSGIKAQVFGLSADETDTLSSVENLLGSDFNDSLTGDAGANQLDGGLGDDLLIGGQGADHLIGGGGVDTASYFSATSAVLVSLAAGTASGGAGSDALVGVENLSGSGFNDILTGNDGMNRLSGSAGDDILDGGRGNDALNGDEGIDTANYAFSTSGIAANLSTGKAKGAGKDTLTGIENLTGSAFKDIFTGDGGANTLLGGAGNDTLDGGAGDDTLDGGADRDIASYASAAAGVTVSLALAGAQNTVGAGLDSLISIEGLAGSGFNDILTGDGLANLLTGGAGNDSLDGGDGTDTLLGGNGGDTLLGGIGNDNLTGGAAADILSGGAGKDRFIYLDAGESTKSARDLITDLTAQDILDLSLIDADTNTAGDQAFVLVAAFSSVAGQYSLTFDAVSGQSLLQADVNGDSKADLVIAFTGDVTGMTAGWVL